MIECCMRTCMGTQRWAPWWIPAALGALGFVTPSSWPAAALLGLGAVPLAVQPLRDVRLGARGPALVAVLVATGRLLLAYGVLLAVGIAISALTP